MATATNDTFCSLDMLAEVASATLQSDPSLSTNSSPRKTKFNSKASVNTPRKSVNNSEKLSLDQIRTLSDKMLIEMFSELICDEIRKNYSFKCFLIPEKCSQIFKSFGSEARARCKMKVHLQSHINDLLLEANGKTCDVFTAEPLHIRRKRLKELNSKSVRKKKKCKQQNIKKKKEIMKDNFADINHVEINEIKSPKTCFQNIDTSVQHHVCGFASETSPNGSCETEKYSRPSTDELRNNAVKHLHAFSHSDLEQSGGNSSQQTKINNSFNQEPFHLSHTSGNINQKNSCGKKVKRRKETNSTKSNYVVKWDLDFDNTSIDNSTDFEFDTKNNSNVPTHHDHTYTSVCGKTYNCDEDSHQTVVKPVKTIKKSCPHHIDACMIIPTPPFPYVYVPILPHICEITEIYSSDSIRSNKCTCGIEESILKKGLIQQNEFILLNEKDLLWRQKYDSIGSEENELDSESTLSDSFLYEDDALSDDATYEINDKLIDTAFNLDDLETDCPPNLQSVEKKLALKYIRALRTKKKDERGPLVCQICKNKSFTAQATLMYHYRSHAGIKPFSCTVCEATFTRQHSLNYHMLIHYNKSRFVCSDCGRNFRHPSHYKEHLRRHTGETPYECTDCTLRFKTRNTYKRHLKTRHGKILTVNGIHCLPDDEFHKVRTSPRKKITRSLISHKKDQGRQWCVFSEKKLYS